MSTASPLPRQQPPPRRGRVATIAVFCATTIAVIASLLIFPPWGLLSALGPHPPQNGEHFAVLADSEAEHAFAVENGQGRAAAEYLGAQPTAYWLTPEHDPIGAVGEHLTELAAQARAQQATLPIVVYGIPGRDCGSHSAGGLSEANYPTWISEIEYALSRAHDVRTVIILEPDSLALADECGNLDARVAQVRSAISSLQRPNSWIYLDGGNSAWHPASEQARRLRVVGLDGVRGFSLNVSNFNDTGDEVRYAHDISAALGVEGMPGIHALIDTSRNGAGSNGEWCNPHGRLVGIASGSIGDDVVDTNLWIKRPGESDGPCNGGPAPGVWWSEAAIELTRSVRE